MTLCIRALLLFLVLPSCAVALLWILSFYGVNVPGWVVGDPLLGAVIWFGVDCEMRLGKE